MPISVVKLYALLDIPDSLTLSRCLMDRLHEQALARTFVQ